MTDIANHSGPADTAALLVTPPALIAFLTMAGASWLRTMLIERMSQDYSAGEFNTAMIGLAAFVGGIVLAVLGAALHFMVSRSLAGPPGSARAPAIGLWLALAAISIIISFAVSALASLVYHVLLGGGEIQRFTLILLGINVAVRVVLFPLNVFMVGLAHNGRTNGLGALIGFLLSKGIGYPGMLAAVGIVFVVGQAPLTLALPMALVPIVQSLAAGAAQVLFIVIAIGAYRAFRLASDGSSATFR